MNETTEQNTKKTNPRREELVKLSNQAKAIRQNMIDGSTTTKEALYWSSKTINYMLLNHMYNTEGATEFNTFKQWKEKGATVKKGSKAFAVWGQPLARQKQEQKEAKGEKEEDDSNFDYFPICFLFSDKQVTTPEDLESEKAKRKEDQERREEKKEALKVLQTVELD